MSLSSILNKMPRRTRYSPLALLRNSPGANSAGGSGVTRLPNGLGRSWSKAQAERMRNHWQAEIMLPLYGRSRNHGSAALRQMPEWRLQVAWFPQRGVCGGRHQPINAKDCRQIARRKKRGSRLVEFEIQSYLRQIWGEEMSDGRQKYKSNE